MPSQNANDRRLPIGLGSLDVRPAQGVWEGHQLEWHINCLELIAVFLALKYLLWQLRGCHVLVRMDNTAAVSYINHQGGLHSLRLNRLAQQIFIWVQDKFLPQRAICIPGHLNVGANLLSRQRISMGEWKLYRGNKINHGTILQSGGGPLRLPTVTQPPWVWMQRHIHGPECIYMLSSQFICSWEF